MGTFEQDIQSQLSDIKQAAHSDAAMRSRIALQGVKPVNTSDTPGKGIASPGDKLMAIQDVYDLQEKTSIAFIVLGDLARAIRDKQPEYDGEAIQVGFKANHLVPEVKSLFKQWGFVETKYGYKYYFTPPTKWDIKVPVEIYCWTKHYPFFDNPDIGFFGVDEFRLPNPFEAYWKVRGIIR